jgi:hypothetical protein
LAAIDPYATWSEVDRAPGDSHPLIKSDPERIFMDVHADVKLEDLYTWD